MELLSDVADYLSALKARGLDDDSIDQAMEDAGIRDGDYVAKGYIKDSGGEFVLVFFDYFDEKRNLHYKEKSAKLEDDIQFNLIAEDFGLRVEYGKSYVNLKMGEVNVAALGDTSVILNIQYDRASEILERIGKGLYDASPNQLNLDIVLEDVEKHLRP